MRAKLVMMTLLPLIVAAGTAGLFALRRNNARLQQHLSSLRQQNAHMIQVAAENERTRDLVARAQAGEAEAAQEIRSELAQARAEMVDLQKSAEERRAKKTAVTAAAESALATNRDPEKGFVRIENFSNTGRGTPATAFQTLVWAAAKGDDDTLASTLALTGAAREKADALIAALPADAQSKYPTPEKLVALFLASLLLNQTAVQIEGQTASDAQHITLIVSSADGGKTNNFSFISSVVGWQLVVPDKVIDQVQNQLRGASSRSPTK